MPYDPDTNLFTRVWRFETYAGSEDGDDILQSVMDAALDDLAEGLQDAFDALGGTTAGVQRYWVGDSEPSGADPEDLWLDISADPWVLNIRNAADNSWIEIMQIDDVTDTIRMSLAVLTMTGNISFTNDGEGINDASGNELLRFTKSASAVNYLNIANAGTGAGPTLSAKGDDTNVDIKLTPKGSGSARITAGGIIVEAGNVQINTGFLADSNGNEALVLTKVSSAVNYVEVTNSATGNSAKVSANGDDTNIALELIPKGTGAVLFPVGAVATPAFAFTGDPNTGLYWIGADNIGIAAGGVKIADMDGADISLDVSNSQAFKIGGTTIFEMGSGYAQIDKQIRCAAEAVSYGASFNVDMSLESVKEFTTSSTSATATLTNIAAGQSVLCLITCGDASASLAWSGVDLWIGGSAPTLSTTPGEVDVVAITVQADGSTVIGSHVGVAA